MWDKVEEVKERLDKLEVSQHKRMITLAGLYTDDIYENKFVVIQQIADFFADTMGYRPAIDDVYEIGDAMPRMKVVIFQSIKDKGLIMKYKSFLKDFKNESNKSYFVNDFFPPQQNEERRHNRVMLKANEEKADNKLNMEIKGGRLLIDGEQYINKVTPPNPQQIVDLSVEELEKVMKARICKGQLVEKDGNQFIAFTYCVESCKQVNEAYLKMRLCYPKARHIMCAYRVKEEELDQNKQGANDDGEHSASTGFDR